MSQKLTVKWKKFAVGAIEQMMGQSKYNDGPNRLRNFILINFGVNYSLGYCSRIWRQFSKKSACTHVKLTVHPKTDSSPPCKECGAPTLARCACG